jgi:hypothetical protein
VTCICQASLRASRPRPFRDQRLRQGGRVQACRFEVGQIELLRRMPESPVLDMELGMDMISTLATRNGPIILEYRR